MVGLLETFDAVTSTVQDIARDPESPSAATSVSQIVDGIYRVLESPEFIALTLIPPDLRRGVAAELAPRAQRLFTNMRELVSVASQRYELGSSVAWVGELMEAMARLGGALHFLDVPVQTLPPRLAALPVPPMVVRVIDAGGREHFNVLTQLVRRPKLVPYIALAMSRARVTELEPGHWFAEFDGDFPGVWADGASREECLAVLADVLHEWLIVKVAKGDDDLPVLGGLDPRALILS
jgi:predicted RNase H-like HicB family nuclease